MQFALPSFAQPSVPRHEAGKGVPVPPGTGPVPTDRRSVGTGARQETRGVRRRSRGGYAITVDQVAAVRILSAEIHASFEAASKTIDVAELAAVLDWRPARVRALLDARLLTDEQLAQVAERPGQLRRRRRSTLLKIARAYGLDETVVDAWCAAAPEAIASEGKGS